MEVLMTSLEAQGGGSRGCSAAGSWVCVLLVSSTALCHAGPARAADGPLGFYVGAGVGDGNLEQVVSGPAGGVFFPPSFASYDLGWKLMVGARASPWLGGELEYLDFGSGRLGARYLDTENGVPLQPDEFYGANAHSQAAVAMAVGYLPLPTPWLDVYGKLGVARLWSSLSASGYYPDTSVNGVPLNHVSESLSPSDNGFAYGAGIQTHFGAFGLRLEYERISSDVGSPFLVSLGATWTFR
jgi:opacity protein-like surface antigen